MFPTEAAPPPVECWECFRSLIQQWLGQPVGVAAVVIVVLPWALFFPKAPNTNFCFPARTCSVRETFGCSLGHGSAYYLLIGSMEKEAHAVRRAERYSIVLLFVTLVARSKHRKESTSCFTFAMCIGSTYAILLIIFKSSSQIGRRRCWRGSQNNTYRHGPSFPESSHVVS